MPPRRVLPTMLLALAAGCAGAADAPVPRPSASGATPASPATELGGRGAVPVAASSTPVRASQPARAPAACPDGELVLIDTTARVLRLCEDGRAVATMAVALGQGGVGKTREGDARTPLGRYPLAPPRASRSGFGTFIPVGYPTAEQRRAGYTGGAVGIHGPPDGAELADAEVTAIDWTLGCIALARGDLARLVAWVEARAVGVVELVR
ncbi:MAG: L,D-transpeptidase family protein [Kofleriaceae bacterium]